MSNVSNVSDLADKIERMSPPEKLRLAADLLDARHAQIALTVARGVVDEFDLALRLQRLRTQKAEGT